MVAAAKVAAAKAPRALRSNTPARGALKNSIKKPASHNSKTTRARGALKNSIKEPASHNSKTTRAPKKKQRAAVMTKKQVEHCETDCACESAPSLKNHDINAKLLEVVRPCAEDQQRSVTDKIVFALEPTSLGKINQDEVQLVVWRRQEAPKFVTTLADPSIAASALPSFSGVVTPTTVLQKMTKKLRSQKKRALTDEGIDELVGEVTQLVSTFAKIVKNKTVFVKLEVLGDDGCAFWHQDCVPLRLVATYRGPCTEWVHPDFSKETLRHRRFDSKHAQPLSHHDVALFKGRGETQYGDAIFDHPGIVHRSPRIEGSGVYRVVLVLDIPTDFHFA